MNDQNFKNLCLKVFILKNFENAEKNIMKSANFFCFCFILYKEKMFRDKAKLKVEIEDGREAP